MNIEHPYNITYIPFTHIDRSKLNSLPEPLKDVLNEIRIELNQLNNKFNENKRELHEVCYYINELFRAVFDENGVRRPVYQFVYDDEEPITHSSPPSQEITFNDMCDDVDEEEEIFIPSLTPPPPPRRHDLDRYVEKKLPTNKELPEPPYDDDEI